MQINAIKLLGLNAYRKRKGQIPAFLTHNQPQVNHQQLSYFFGIGQSTTTDIYEYFTHLQAIH